MTERRSVAARLAGLAMFAALASCDGGTTGPPPPSAPPEWELLEASPTVVRHHFQDAWFISPDEGWVVESVGRTHHTADGGESWEMLSSQSEVFFRSVVFVSPTLGWIGDLNGFNSPEPQRALWETRDGGRTWTNITDRVVGPEPVGLCGMFSVDAETIYGVGRWSGPAVFVRTDDGGATWESVDLAPLATGAVDVHFFDRDRGLIGAGRGVGNSPEEQQASRTVVLATEDGGRTWEERFVGSAEGSWAWKMSFPSPDVGYVATQGPSAGGIVLKTEDGGRTWSEIVVPGAPDGGFWGLGFATPERGWVGVDGGGVMETNDGGLTWTGEDWAEDQTLNRFRMLTPDLGFAVGARVFRFEAAADR